LGLVGYYRKFVKDFSKIAKPLTRLTKKGENFVWIEEGKAAFSELKHKLTTAPVLTIPGQSGGFVIYSDASGHYLCNMTKWWPLLRDSSSHISRIIQLMTWSWLLLYSP